MGMARGERVLSTIFGIAAISYMVIGLLRGFGYIGPEGVSLPVRGMDEFGGLQAAVAPDFWEAIVWISTGVAAGILAWTFARGKEQSATSQTPRMMAYAMAVVAQAFILLAYFVGFGIINEDAVPTDGVLWGTAAIVAATLAAASYAAIPEPLADEDYLASLLRSRGVTEGTSTATRTGTQGMPRSS